MPQVFYSNKHPNLTVNVIDCSFFFYFFFFVFNKKISSISKFTSSSATYLNKEIFFRLSPCSNALVHYYEYVQLQSLLHEAKRVRARQESVCARRVHGNARSLVRASQCAPRPLQPVRAYYKASAPIMYHPCHVVCSPRPLPPVRAQLRSVRAQLRSILAQSPSIRTYRNKSTPIRIPPARIGRSPRPLLAVDACLGPV
jgi:hypothetical protein